MDYAFAVPLTVLFLTPMFLFGRIGRKKAINEQLNIFIVPIPFASCMLTFMLASGRYLECMILFLIASITTSVSIFKFDSRINATARQYMGAILIAISTGVAWSIATILLRKFL
jgi:hypothetical protein